MCGLDVALQEAFFGIDKAISETLHQPSMINPLANEHCLALPFLRWPRALWHPTEMTVHRVKDVTLRNAFHIQDTFGHMCFIFLRI